MTCNTCGDHINMSRGSWAVTISEFEDLHKQLSVVKQHCKCRMTALHGMLKHIKALAGFDTDKTRIVMCNCQGMVV